MIRINNRCSGIIAQKGDSLWISMRGYLIKANLGQVRRATAEESLGTELVKHLSQQLLEDIDNHQVKFYRDVEAEGLPEEDSMSLAEDEGYSPSQMAEPALESYSPTTPMDSPMEPIPEEVDQEMEEEVRPDLPAPSEASTLVPPSADDLHTNPSVPPSQPHSQQPSRRTSI